MYPHTNIHIYTFWLNKLSRVLRYSCFRYKCIFPSMLCFSGLIFLRRVTIALTSCSFFSPVFFDLNLCNKSFIVIGFLIKYLLTASSDIPSLKQKNAHVKLKYY